MTAVEYIEHMWMLQGAIYKNDIEKALEMEKEQMSNTFKESRLTHPMIGFKHETFVDYYNETFKSE